MICPFKFKELCWPDIVLTYEQNQIIRSVWRDDETIVPAANKMGKDFVAGFIALSFFVLHPVVRVITTSVKDDHLRVLWGELERLIQTSRYPLEADKGGILLINHRDIRKLKSPKTTCKISYLRGMVSEKGEGLAGHHAPDTLLIGDEASGLADVVYTQADTWAKHKLYIGNCHDKETPNNMFKQRIQKGDIPYDD